MENETSITVTANREYKSTMFCMIFRNKKELLELYNAVNHSAYTDTEALQVVTLENAIYMNMKNIYSMWQRNTRSLCRMPVFMHQPW